MVIELLVLLLTTAAWIAGLWLVITPDFTKWSNIGIIAAHILPPMAIWLPWVLLRRRAKKKKAEEDQLRKTKEQAKRTAARDEALKRHQEEMRQRRFGCDCRTVAMAVMSKVPGSPLIQTEVQNINITSYEPNTSEGASGHSIIDRLIPSITQTLNTVYSSCDAAIAFPIFVAPPAEVSGEEVLSRIRVIHEDLRRSSGYSSIPGTTPPSILFLPTNDSAPNSVISLFENTPDLPGAIVLAFDSPFSRMPPHDELEEPDPARTKREQYIGKPCEAVIALLLTNASLPSMLDSVSHIANNNGDHDDMTPFWQKTMLPEGHLALLARASADQRQELAQLPILGRIHRAAFLQADPKQNGTLALMRITQSLMERAQLNAGLIESPFVFEDAKAEKSPDEASKPPQTPCGWVVHNAGEANVVGRRLAALGNALHYFNIDLNPVDMATNTVTRIGNLGRASGIGQLALSVAYAAQHEAPALHAEFSDGDSMAFSFVMPSPEPDEEPMKQAA